MIIYCGVSGEGMRSIDRRDLGSASTREKRRTQSIPKSTSEKGETRRYISLDIREQMAYEQSVSSDKGRDRRCLPLLSPLCLSHDLRFSWVLWWARFVHDRSFVANTVFSLRDQRHTFFPDLLDGSSCRVVRFERNGLSQSIQLPNRFLKLRTNEHTHSISCFSIHSTHRWIL